MTEDYKSKLIKYLTGNINFESGTNEPQFIDKGSQNNDFYDYLSTSFPSGWSYQGTLQIPNLPYFVIYGQYDPNNDGTYYGFIFIMDSNMSPISLLTEYDSGTKFRPFACLNVDEDGYFYGIDQKNELYDTSVPKSDRFIMLNKIMSSNRPADNYYAKLRISYYIPSNIQNQYSGWGLIAKDRLLKQIDTGNYYFIVDTTSGMGVIGLSINVGQENTWTFVGNSDLTTGNVICSYVEYSGESLKITIGGESNSNSDNYAEVLYTSGESPTIVTKNIISNPDGGYISDIIKIGTNTCYIGYMQTNEQTNEQTIAIYRIDYTNNKLILLKKFTTQNVNYLGPYVNFNKIDNIVFFKYNWDTRNASTSNPEGNFYLGMILNDELFYTQALNVPVSTNFLQNKIYINNVYNLFTIYTPLPNGDLKKIQLVYNSINYNGLPYEAPNCLVPNSSILYDTDNNIIFARNLYNKTVLGATTTSTVQIPNTMLNDVTIGKSDLISETNLPLTEDETDITKNIYETVNINFANSISIRNDNVPNNKILNPTAAARLNGSTTQNNNYDDVKATKVRVNYTDGTNMIIKLNPKVQIGALTATVYQYNFILYVRKAINNLEIISNDELTSYQTIDNLTLEVGKTYNILQGVEIQ